MTVPVTPEYKSVSKDSHISLLPWTSGIFPYFTKILGPLVRVL